MKTLTTVTFARRLLAGAIDATLPATLAGAGVWLALASRAPWAPAAAAWLGVASFAAFVALEAAFPALAGTTPGTRVAGYRIARADLVSGRQTTPGIGLLAGATRAAAILGVSPAFFLGFAWHFVDPRRRMWHDILAATVPVPAGTPAPTLVSHSPIRRVLGLLLGLAGSVTILTLLILLVALGRFFGGLPTGIASVPTPTGVSIRLRKLPADFPDAIVVGAKEDIVDVVVTPLAAGRRKRAEISWGRMEADPVSVILAYKTGLELLRFTTRVEYLAAGPRLAFSDADGSVQGSIALVPRQDAKTIASLTMTVEYPAATSTLKGVGE